MRSCQLSYLEVRFSVIAYHGSGTGDCMTGIAI